MERVTPDSRLCRASVLASVLATHPGDPSRAENIVDPGHAGPVPAMILAEPVMFAFAEPMGVGSCVARG